MCDTVRSVGGIAGCGRVGAPQGAFAVSESQTTEEQ
jgi:hypothetical protein